jgi:hypothetical protein
MDTLLFDQRHPLMLWIDTVIIPLWSVEMVFWGGETQKMHTTTHEFNGNEELTILIDTPTTDFG